jgi:hypothetical protein
LGLDRPAYIAVIRGRAVKRRAKAQPLSWPPGLAEFSPEDWLEPDEEELRERAEWPHLDLTEHHRRRRWFEARSDWQAANGFPFWDEFIADLSMPI